MNSRDFLIGAGVGAALAYMLDPNGGGRRRALARDKVVRATRRTRDGLDATARDLANRTRGIAAATRGRLAHEEVDDAVLVERVRAKIGRVSSHPRAIDVEANGGDVTLRGPILSHEVSRVLATAANVRGVASVSNELDPHESPEGVPSLQGAGRTAGPGLDILQRNWAPATQALVTVAGIAATGMAVAAYGRR
jgi:hypothetical protein